jgi:methionyl aminopeptidase
MVALSLPLYTIAPDKYNSEGKPKSELQRIGQAPRILSSEEQEKMRTVCRVSEIGTFKSTVSHCQLRLHQLAREVLDIAGSHVKPGITTDEIDEIVHNAIIERNAYPSPLNYREFPKSVCTQAISPALVL